MPWSWPTTYAGSGGHSNWCRDIQRDETEDAERLVKARGVGPR
jgi:hypothetical protein